MSLSELRILPPLAIGRFGSSSQPLEAYELLISKTEPLGHRSIVPCETLEVDSATGAIARVYVPPNIRFKDGDRIRPVAPFLEVFARTDGLLEPLTLDLLAAEGLGPEAVRWTVEVGNNKVFRRTRNENDKVFASVPSFHDHAEHALRGACHNFLPKKFIPLGHVRYIQPTKEFPEIRLRFTPAHGFVYGASDKRHTSDTKEEDDKVFEHAPERIIYDPARGWRGYSERTIAPTGPALTNPGAIYAGYERSGPGKPWVSWGYLDDGCDGIVAVEITLKNGRSLKSHAHISAGPPAFAPDSLPIRTVADELEQILLGPEADSEALPLDEALEIVRRALDTVRLLNTAVMNGNIIDGRANIASTMVRQDTGDYGRQFAPIMATSLVDNFAVRSLHERVFAALSSGSAPWFAAVLRRPEEIGDFSDKGRRKMPAMMRGADGRMLTLTRRQIHLILHAATSGLFHDVAREGSLKHDSKNQSS